MAYSIVKTGEINVSYGDAAKLPDKKERLPLVTIKGNYRQHRSGGSLVERSPFICVDVDIATSGVDKTNLTPEQREKINSDLPILIDTIMQWKHKPFFLKHSFSHCGLHLIFKVNNAVESINYMADRATMRKYEGEIFFQISELIGSIQSKLHFKYIVDSRMSSDSQPLFLNHDPNAIYNPANTIDASEINIIPEYVGAEYKEEEIPEKSLTDSINYRDANPVDASYLMQFNSYCDKKNIKLSYDDIMYMTIIFFTIWEEGTFEHFTKYFNGMVKVWSKQHQENISVVLKRLYNGISKSCKTYKGNRVTLRTLYYILKKYSYEYTPDVTIHFSGYLSIIVDKLYEYFSTEDKILLQAPTGGGKSKLLMKYLMLQAKLNPTKNYVLALPYTSMVQQFTDDYKNDEEFDIQTLYYKKSYRSRNQHTAIGDIILEKYISQNHSPSKHKKNRKQEMKKKNLEKMQKNHKGSIFNLMADDFIDKRAKRKNLFFTTYDSVEKIKNIALLVIDEAHNLTKALGYRRHAINNLLSKKCDKVVYTTATPDCMMPEIGGFFHINCIKDDKEKTPLYVEMVQGDPLKALMDNIKLYPNSISFLNDKKKCNEVKTLLEKDDVHVTLYNRDTKESKAQRQFQSSGNIQMPAIATAFLGEGVNVLNHVEWIFLVDIIDIDDIIQSSNRPRNNIPSVKLFIKKTKYDPISSFYSKMDNFLNKLSYYQKVASELQEIADANPNFRHSVSNLDPDNDMIYYQDKTDEEIEKLYSETPFIPSVIGKMYIVEHTRETYVSNSPKGYMVDIAQLKFKVNSHYKYWLYHKRRDVWKKMLSANFIVQNFTETENDVKINIAKTPFEVFMNTSKSVILDFAHKESSGKIKLDEAKERKLIQISKELNHLPQTAVWKRWTERYIALDHFQYPLTGKLDYDLIKNGISYNIWERQLLVNSLYDYGVFSPSGERILKRYTLIINFLLTNYSKGEFTRSEFFQLINDELKKNGMSKEKGDKILFSGLKSVLGIKIKQKSTGERVVAEVIDKRPQVGWKQNQLDKETEEFLKTHFHL